MKIVHFADAHVGMENYGIIDPKTGLNSRLLDFEKSLNFIADSVEKIKPELILFAGDAYKDRHPTPTHLQIFSKPLIKMAKVAPVVMVVGNHDTPAALGKANTLDIFPTVENPNIYLSRKPEVLKIPTNSGKVQILTLPWISKSSFDVKKQIDFSQKIAETIKDLTYQLNPNFPTFFLGHGTVEGAVYGSERSVMLGADIIVPLSALTQKEFKYVALGHLHKFQQLRVNPPVVYSGSIERIDFGEEKEEKGFVVYNTESKKLDFIKTPSRKFKTIELEIGNKDEHKKVLSRLKKEKIKEAIIKILIKMPEEQASLISENEIRKALKDAFLIASISKEIGTKENIKEKVEYSNYLTSLSPIETINEFIKQRKISAKLAELIKKYAKDLIEEIQ